MVRISPLALLVVIALSVTPLGASCESHARVEPWPSGPAARVQYDARRTPTERSAWMQINAGQEVRLPGPCPDWRKADPQTQRTVDPSNYTLRGAFIAQLLTRSPSSGSSCPRGTSLPRFPECESGDFAMSMQVRKCRVQDYDQSGCHVFTDRKDGMIGRFVKK